jgi:hypothetical protein
MNLFEMTPVDLIGVLLGFTLTLLIFSYVWGDNPLFRLTIHMFIGVSAGYVTLIVFNNVILPQLIFKLASGDRNEIIIAAVYLIPSMLVLTKMSPRLSKLGNPALAFLAGTGAAVAVGGAVIGTIKPQVAASVNVFEAQTFSNAAIILLGTLATLIYFHFGEQKKSDQLSRSAQIVKGIGFIGQVFIAITFGALFAGVLYAALTALIERFTFLWTFIKDFLLPSVL